jgi:hypothetical protein
MKTLFSLKKNHRSNPQTEECGGKRLAGEMAGHPSNG